MAKILICGMNKNQCTRKFYLRQQLKVVPSHYSLYNCLIDMGHTVEQRQVTIGEDLSMFDEIVVFIAGPRQLVATQVFEGLYAIAQRPNCILAVDDWQVPDLFKGIIKCEDWNELTAKFILDVNKKTIEDVEPFKEQFLAATKQIASMKNRMLISAFRTEHLNDPDNYGPHLLFDKIEYPREKLFVFNPNPYHRNRSWEDVGHEGDEDPTWKRSPLDITQTPRPEKERRFNFASLVQSKTQKWLKKQGYTGNPKNDEQGDIAGWPVDLYGSKADTQKRLTEDEMVKVLTRDWGCLMPGYEHAGSGWWRARPLQCAHAFSILIGEEKELRVYYGKEYKYYGLKATDLVNLSEDELAEIAFEQHKCLFEIHGLDKRQQQNELQAVLDAK
ncbi:hypothetical protein [Acinetobacter sp.]|uniref:hypothetical protein n=1 Tax=Acinetobacter sp. TaxID=472 RepID=UPI00388E3564